MLDYTAKHNDMTMRHKPGTGTWLLGCNTFKTWMKTPKQTLFCPGIPGAGKTIMASIVINHLQQKFDNTNTGISYVYCNYNERHGADKLVACLIKQLLVQLPGLPHQVQESYKAHIKRKTFLQRDEFLQVLKSVTQSFSRVFVVIDAIDEYQDENSRITFLQFIEEIKKFVNLLVTSRHIPSIEEVFKGDPKVNISATDEDITMYVQSEICREDFTLSKELSQRSELCEDVVKKIISKARGMYVSQKQGHSRILLIV